MGELNLEGCSYRYKKSKKNILNNININIPEKAITAIVGTNGSGKSTFLKCLAGIMRWNEGSCLFEGRDTKNLWKFIGYVPQVKDIPFNYKVAEFISFGKKDKVPSLTNNTLEKQLFKDVYKILCELEIEDIMNEYCGEISGGQMQMAYLGYALISNPKILLLDEPELNLDLYRQKQLTQILKRKAKQGTTIIINSHYIDSILNLADKCLLLKESDYKFGDTEIVLNESTIKDYLKIEGIIKDIELKPNIKKNIFIPV